MVFFLKKTKKNIVIPNTFFIFAISKTKTMLDMKKILLLITLIGLSACVFAEEWEQHGPVYIDKSTLIKTENSAQAWMIRPNFDKSKIYNPKYTYDLALVDARCKTNEIAILNTKWYNNRHELIQGINVGEPATDYFKVKPNTNNEVLFNSLCPKPVKKRS